MLGKKTYFKDSIRILRAGTPLTGSRSIVSRSHVGWLSVILLLIAFAAVDDVFAAGFEQLEVPASGGEPTIEAMVWTPCAGDSGSSEIGPYSVRAIPDCAVTAQSLPLVVISHGYGGSLLGHHDTATALADAGFVVATLNHPGDFYGDDSGAHQLSIFESRPRDVSRVISFMLERWEKRETLDPEAIGVMGFSRGGTTALLLSGAEPSISASAERFCDPWWSFVQWQCRQLNSGEAGIDARADSRIRAAVVMDPLNLFDAAGLESVGIPIQLWASEMGGDKVELQHVKAIRASLPKITDYHEARGAGHFAYLAPCTPAFTESAPKICEDPAGFDRTDWHKKMNTAVVEFFKRQLQSKTQAVTQNSG